jgi:hypothetical protein
MSARFTKPTRADLIEYAAEIGYASFDPDRFLDHYQMVGWRVGGRAPMKDWRAAVRNWRRNQREWNGPEEHQKKREAVARRRRLKDAEEREYQTRLDEMLSLLSWDCAEKNAEAARHYEKIRDVHGAEFARRLRAEIKKRRKDPS